MEEKSIGHIVKHLGSPAEMTIERGRLNLLRKEGENKHSQKKGGCFVQTQRTRKALFIEKQLGP